MFHVHLCREGRNGHLKHAGGVQRQLGQDPLVKPFYVFGTPKHLCDMQTGQKTLKWNCDRLVRSRHNNFKQNIIDFCHYRDLNHSFLTLSTVCHLPPYSLSDLSDGRDAISVINCCAWADIGATHRQ